jgi:hypothetical protein
MKKLFTLILSFTTSVTYAQCNVASFIIDSDGYVNVRSDANSKAEIVAKINSGTTVYYERNSNSKWYHISLKKSGTPLGYVHSSRLYASEEWPLLAYINNIYDTFTDICDSPNGNVILQLPTEQSYSLELSDYKNGWWKIERLELINYEQGEKTSLPIPSNTDYWICTTNINSEIQGDGYCPFDLLTIPENGAPIIKSYPNGEFPTAIANLLELSRNKLFIKIILKDGHIGWAPINLICYNPFTTCTSCY